VLHNVCFRENRAYWWEFASIYMLDLVQKDGDRTIMSTTGVPPVALAEPRIALGLKLAYSLHGRAGSGLLAQLRSD